MLYSQRDREKTSLHTFPAGFWFEIHKTFDRNWLFPRGFWGMRLKNERQWQDVLWLIIYVELKLFISVPSWVLLSCIIMLKWKLHFLPWCVSCLNDCGPHTYCFHLSPITFCIIRLWLLLSCACSSCLTKCVSSSRRFEVKFFNYI